MPSDYEMLYQILLTNDKTGSQIFALFLLSMCRILPILTLASFFGAKVLPHPVKMGLGICIFAIILPKLLVVTKEPIPFDAFIIFIALKEFFIGYALGIFALVPFWVVEMAGLVTDHQRGGAALNVQDPTLQSQSSPLATFNNLILIYLFYIFNGPFIFLEILVDSFDKLPPDQMLTKLFFYDKTPFWQAIIQLFGHVATMGIQLASPALLAILMTDMFLGIINRMAPQVMITFLGMPLKSLLGLALICLGWKLFTNQMITQALLWLNKIKEIVSTLGIGH